MSASGPRAIGVLACALSCVAVLGCGHSSTTRAARSADLSAPPSPVIGSSTPSYPPADPVSVASCAGASDVSYCTEPSGLRIAPVHAGQPCHLATDAPGVQHGSWRKVGGAAATARYRCRPGAQ